MANKPNSVDEYLTAYPEDVQERLKAMRATIKAAAPEAEEVISYGMPAYVYKGDRFIYFAGNKGYIGVYPMPTPPDEAFARRIAAYKGTKSSLHFPHSQPLPLDLLAEMVQYHVQRIDGK